jgi:putative permease
MIINNRQNIQRIQILFFAVIILSFCFFVLAVPRISLPLSLAYIFSLALAPMVSALMMTGLSKTQSIVLIFIILAFLVGFPLMKMIPVISVESENLHYSIPKIEQYVLSQIDVLRGVIKFRTGYVIQDSYVLDAVENTKNAIATFLLKLPNILANLMEWIFLIPFFTFFIIRDSDQFKKMFLSFTPNIIFERFYHVTYTFNRQLGNYFFAKFVEAFIVGGIITFGLILFGVKYAIVLGLVAGLTNIVPYVGPFLGVIPAVILGIGEYGLSSSTFGAIVILYLIANVVDIFFVFPFLVSKIVNLHPMVVAVSVIVGSHYLGITGMVISIPVVAAIKLIIIEIYNEIYTERAR